MKFDVAGRRFVIGAISVAGAILVSSSSSSRVVLVAAAFAFAVGWATILILIRLGDARGRQADGPVLRSQGRLNLAAAIGVAFWILAGAIAEKFVPGAGKDIVGASLLAFLGGLMLGLRFSQLGRSPI